MTTETTGETMDLTPNFNYSRETEIVKRFIEKAYSRQFESPFELVAWLGQVEPEIRRAMGLVLSNDIERQIVITKEFPLRQQLYVHAFNPAPQHGDWPIGEPEPRCAEPDCYGLADTLAHLLA